tara:strand:+ start:466 stop:1116 length:651 start_codon:yes stop_codon:yes gene_type:complete
MPLTLILRDNTHFNLTDEIWKPLPDYIISVLREPEGINNVRDGVILEELQPSLKSKLKFFEKRLTLLRNLILSMEETAEKSKDKLVVSANDLVWDCKVKNTEGLPVGVYSMDAIRRVQAHDLKSAKDLRLQLHLLRYILNKNKVMVDETFRKLKLQYGEDLENMEETQYGFVVADRGDPNSLKYAGNDKHEQNYIKLAELLQERINMFNNLTAILF